MGYGWLNLGSLLLGLTAWILPLWELRRRLSGKGTRELPGAGSFVCCALALLFQLLYGRHLVLIRDWSALMDTAGAVVVAAGVLFAGTVLVNLPLCLCGTLVDQEDDIGTV